MQSFVFYSLYKDLKEDHDPEDVVMRKEMVMTVVVIWILLTRY